MRLTPFASTSTLCAIRVALTLSVAFTGAYASNDRAHSEADAQSEPSVVPLPVVEGVSSPSESQAEALNSSQDVRVMWITRFDSERSPSQWITVNDNVMGGRSTGGPVYQDNIVTFRGSTNTNGGGFSSIRSRPVRLNLEEFDAIRLRIRADGRTYKFELRTDERLGGRLVDYWAEFQVAQAHTALSSTLGAETKNDGWHEVTIPFTAFRPSIFGRDVSRFAEPLDTSAVRALGFMIYDGLDGPFQLQVDWVQAVNVSDESTVGWSQVDSNMTNGKATDQVDDALRLRLGSSIGDQIDAARR